jgi:nitrite reductase/ring-hydroxylating ferredoxin subunit/uncharacterized membrane protein
VARFIARLLAAQDGWARPFGDFNHRWLNALFRPMLPIRDVLNGTWLGHPVHSAVTDVPIGALGVSVILDLANQRGAADIAPVRGILPMPAAAVRGAPDYSDTAGSPRVRATIHSTLMVVALLVFLVSVLLRVGNPVDRTAPVVVSIIGFLILTAAAYVGGDVVYLFGNMVDRHAWRGAGTKWLPLEAPDDLPEARPTKAKLGINSLVLVRRGDTISALHDTCAHAGGPLSQGQIVDGCIECPWHGSRYRLEDGVLRRGPAVYDQPTYEVRRAEGGGWEARRRS